MLCELCRRFEALYVCRECGRKICEACFSPELWLCSACSAASVKASEGGPQTLPSLLLLGFILILAGIALLIFSALNLPPPPARGEGFFFFFPFPLIFGFCFGGGEPLGAVVFLAATIIFILVVAFMIYLLFKALKLGFKG